MNKIEILYYLIEHHGKCFHVPCEDCPLNIKRASGLRSCQATLMRVGCLSRRTADDACVIIAQRMLKEIAENVLLGNDNYDSETNT